MGVEKVLNRPKEESIELIAQSCNIMVHLAGEVRIATLYEKQNGKLFYWSPFSGKGMEFFREALDKIRVIPKKLSGEPPYKHRVSPAQASERRISEHVGDSFVAVAASIISVQRFPLDRKAYGVLFHSLITNANLKTAGYTSGAAAETEIGKTFREKGTGYAIQFALCLLRKTQAAKLP